MENRNLRKERIGVVTSNRMEKSIVVSEVKRVKHPMYGKFVLRTKKYVVPEARPVTEVVPVVLSEITSEKG